MTRNDPPSINPAHQAIIVSDVLLYRDGIASGIARQGDFQVAGVCGCGEAQAVVARCNPDLVFLDMSRAVALQLPRQIAAGKPTLPIVGFGVGSDDEAVACAEAGIIAFVNAEGTIEDLNRTALLALEGKLVCSAALTAKLVQRLATLAEAQAPAPSNGLTSREQQIAGLVDEGLSNKEIANTLCISPATVKNHVHAILEKLNIHRRNAIRRQLSVGR